MNPLGTKPCMPLSLPCPTPSPSTPHTLHTPWSLLHTCIGTKFRQMLRAGDDIPEWFAFKSVVQVLREQILKEAN